MIFSGFWIMFWQVFYALPFYVTDILKIERFELLETVDALGIIFLSIPATALMKKVRPIRAMAGGFAVASASWLVITLSQSWQGVVVAMLLFALGESMQAPRFYEYVADLAPEGQTGTYMGFAFLPVAIGAFAAGRSRGTSSSTTSRARIPAACGFSCPRSASRRRRACSSTTASSRRRRPRPDGGEPACSRFSRCSSRFAAFGFAAWLRERVVRLENEVAALRARREEERFSLKVNIAAEHAAAPPRATDASAPPVAFPAPPVALAPPPITPSKQSADAAAPPIAFGPGLPVREGAEEFLPAPPPAARMDWESFVGIKLFSWIAGIFLTIGAILFLRYSIDRGWLTEPVQMAIGLAAGAGLLVLCELRAARRYAVTANALDAAGLVILFSTLFAAHARWGILGSGPAFVALAAVAALAVILAVRHDSTFIALLGLLGGFATPVLLGTTWPVLFPFLGLLAAGLFVFAVLRKAPLLHTLAGLATLAVLGSWFVRSLTPDLLVPALTAACGLSLFYFFAPALGARLAPPDPLPAGAAGLGLMGHVLLLFVAAERSLSAPPAVSEALALFALTAAATFAARRAGAAWVHAAGPLPRAPRRHVLHVHGPPRRRGRSRRSRRRAPSPSGGSRRGSSTAPSRSAARPPWASRLAQAVAIAVTLVPGVPPLRAVLTAQALFLVALFAVAAGAPEPRLSVLAAGLAVLAPLAWGFWRRSRAPWQEVALFAGVLWPLFVLHPVVLGRRRAAAARRTSRRPRAPALPVLRARSRTAGTAPSSAPPARDGARDGGPPRAPPHSRHPARGDARPLARRRRALAS